MSIYIPLYAESARQETSEPTIPSGIGREGPGMIVKSLEDYCTPKSKRLVAMTACKCLNQERISIKDFIIIAFLAVSQYKFFTEEHNKILVYSISI